LRETQQAGRRTHEIEPPEERAQQPPVHLMGAGAFVRTLCPLDLAAGSFDQLAVANAGGADGFTGAAVQTLPHLLDEAGAEEI
jgi:hypothetical protein